MKHICIDGAALALWSWPVMAGFIATAVLAC
jgi:hypothetical protein